jgi:hypothetical protein
MIDGFEITKFRAEKSDRQAALEFDGKRDSVRQRDAVVTVACGTLHNVERAKQALRKILTRLGLSHIGLPPIR